jgi:hypothetical protein
MKAELTQLTVIRREAAARPSMASTAVTVCLDRSISSSLSISGLFSPRVVAIWREHQHAALQRRSWALSSRS